MYKSVIVLAVIIASASAFVPAHRQPVVAVKAALYAEPSDNNINYEESFKKLQKEAEERLEDKVNELIKNIDTVGRSAK